MAINQILAPYYLKMKYQTYAAVHSMRVYFETGSILQAPTVLAPGEYTIRGSAAVQDVPISQVAFGLFDRYKNNLPANTQLQSIEIWQAQEGVNLFVADNVLPATTAFGVGTGVAAAYDMFVFGGTTRQKFRLTFFDTKVSAPQRASVAAPPTVDNGSIVWFMLKGLVPFATQDGIRLTGVRSANTGYNRKLARSYGRTIAP